MFYFIARLPIIFSLFFGILFANTAIYASSIQITSQNGTLKDQFIVGEMLKVKWLFDGSGNVDVKWIQDRDNDGVYETTFGLFQGISQAPSSSGSWTTPNLIGTKDAVCPRNKILISRTNGSSITSSNFAIVAKGSSTGGCDNKIGTYTVYLGEGSTRSYFTLDDVSGSDAFSSCQTIHKNNPYQSIKCLWRQEVLYNFTYGISVITPNGGREYRVGDTIPINWESTSKIGVYVSLVQDRDGDGNYETSFMLSGNTLLPANGKIDWTIPEQIYNMSLTGARNKISIISAPGEIATIKDTSDRDFSILDAIPKRSMYKAYVGDSKSPDHFFNGVTKVEASEYCIGLQKTKGNQSIRCLWDDQEFYTYVIPISNNTPIISELSITEKIALQNFESYIQKMDYKFSVYIRSNLNNRYLLNTLKRKMRLIERDQSISISTKKYMIDTISGLYSQYSER